MNFLSLKRVVRTGLISYKRNFWLSTASTTVMVITLFIVSSLIILSSLTNLSLQSIHDKVDISVFFTHTTNESTVFQIQRQIELLSEIKSIEYIPPVMARERFLELHKNEPLLIEAVEQFDDSENPFPASFAIRVGNLEDYPKIISLFQEDRFRPFVSKITDKRDIVDRLNNITTGIRNFGLMLTLVFSTITVLVMFNTIRLTIYNRKEEIEIMRLVGASNAFIRGPFLVEGIVHGVVGALITAIIIFPLLYVSIPKISLFLELQLEQMVFFGLNAVQLLLLQLVFGVVLGVISSVIVIRRYLRI